MMKKLISLLLLFVSTAHSYTTENDIFDGMLKNYNGQIMFVRCDSPSLRMQIMQTKDANKSNIERAYRIAAQQHYKDIYFTFFGNVQIENNSYIFNIQDIVNSQTGTCNLLEALS